MITLNKKEIWRICIWAFMVRLLMLLCVVSFSPMLSSGLMGSTYDQDDVRYVGGAEIYMETADSMIDTSAIKIAFDNVEPWAGHDEGIELWYWIVCVIMYLFRSDLVLRLLNILFAIGCVKCIYDICFYYYSERVAKVASILYALMPYPVIFSCFLYKDQFYTLVTLLLIRKAIKCAKHIKLKDIIYLSLGITVSMLTRTGLVVLILALVLLIIYKEGKYRVNPLTLLMGLTILCLSLGYVVYISWDIIMEKVYAYILEYVKEEDGIINYFVIKSPSQFYRYPFSLLFLLLLPLNYTFEISTWMSIAGVLNFIGIPIAIGNLCFLLKYSIKKGYFYWMIQLFYFLTIITSLGITRHQYYLQAFSMMFFSAFYCRYKYNEIFNMVNR